MVGRAEAIDACRAHPLARALRIDKLSLAALEATLRLYRDPTRALARDPGAADARGGRGGAAGARGGDGARDRRRRRGGDPRVRARSAAGRCRCSSCEGPVCAVDPGGSAPTSWRARLRAADPPVVGRTRDGLAAARSAHADRRRGADRGRGCCRGAWLSAADARYCRAHRPRQDRPDRGRSPARTPIACRRSTSAASRSSWATPARRCRAAGRCRWSTCRGTSASSARWSPGATGIDLFLMCIAADDGVMPQTREHMAVLRQLGVERGVVAITKSDVADPAGAVAEAAELVPGAEVVPVAALRGDGLDELRAALDRARRDGARSRAVEPDAPARLHVDRSFTLKGIGTVVTGTLWSGAVGARAIRSRSCRAGSATRVRSVQVHDRPVERAAAGQRVALNLVGRRRATRWGAATCIVARRGDDSPHSSSTRAWSWKPGARRSNAGTRVHVHHGTRESAGARLSARRRLRPAAPGVADRRAAGRPRDPAPAGAAGHDRRRPSWSSAPARRHAARRGGRAAGCDRAAARIRGAGAEQGAADPRSGGADPRALADPNAPADRPRSMRMPSRCGISCGRMASGPDGCGARGRCRARS